MKKLRVLIWIIIPIVIEKGFAQIDTILWETGNKYTLLSELGKVWIYHYNGPTIKDVKIHQIDTLKGKVIYIRERTLHDAHISNIKMITPSKFFNQCITFVKYKPLIKRYPESAGYPNGNFISHQKPITAASITPPAEIEKQIETTSTPTTVNVNTKNESSESKTNLEADGRVIYGNGKSVDVKIISINANQVTYKRIDLINGPLYIMSLSVPGKLKQAKVYSKDGLTTVDYSK